MKRRYRKRNRPELNHAKDPFHYICHPDPQRIGSFPFPRKGTSLLRFRSDFEGVTDGKGAHAGASPQKCKPRAYLHKNYRGFRKPIGLDVRLQLHGRSACSPDGQCKCAKPRARPLDHIYSLHVQAIHPQATAGPVCCGFWLTIEMSTKGTAAKNAHKLFHLRLGSK